jgi:hypothetical protein
MATGDDNNNQQQPATTSNNAHIQNKEAEEKNRATNTIGWRSSGIWSRTGIWTTTMNVDERPSVPDMDELGHLMENSLGGENGDANADAVLNGTMEHCFLFKELMYEPMKQVAERFPQWLREHPNDADSAQRELQSQCFQQLVHVYETEPHNGAKLMDLMTEGQEFGQPPSEIVQRD